MSSAAVPPKKHSGHRESHSGIGRKPFAFPPESLFAFSPESRSSSPRNRFRVHPGMLFALPRNPQLAGTAVIVLVAPGNALRAGERDSPNDRISSGARQEIKSVEREVDRAEFESPTRAKSVTLARAQGRPFRKTTQ